MPDYESPNVDETGPERAPKDPRRFDGQFTFGSPFDPDFAHGAIWNVDHKTITAWARMVKRQFKIDPEIQERAM